MSSDTSSLLPLHTLGVLSLNSSHSDKGFDGTKDKKTVKDSWHGQGGVNQESLVAKNQAQLSQ